MLNFRFFVLIIISFAASVVSAETDEEKGLRIALEAEQYDKGFGDFSANMEMILRNRKGKESTRVIRTQTLEVVDDGDKSLVVFSHPADVKGTALLTFTHGLDADDQWLYLPALKRVKRISSNNKSGPFMGSEFAFEDLNSQEVDKYSYKYIGEESCGEWECHIIERIPEYKHSGYTRQISWIDTEKYRTAKTEYYDRKNSLLKILTMTDYKEYLGHYWRPSTMEMQNKITGKSTTLNWLDYKFQTGLTSKDFQHNKLKNIQ